MQAINIEEELKYIEKVKEINKDKILKYYILTMGCQLNENDSEKLCAMLDDMGYIKGITAAECDLIIYNTCAVRENAELKVYERSRFSFI